MNVIKKRYCLYALSLRHENRAYKNPKQKSNKRKEYLYNHSLRGFFNEGGEIHYVILLN